MARVLDGRVALVTGASKNIGKGIALEVAASGAVTYLTARSLEDVPGQLASLNRTVAEIEALGGTAIAVACDHTDDAQVEAVFDRIRSEQGRLDLVVNVASPDFSEMVGVPFWEIPFRHITNCLEIGPRSDYVTTALAARMMIPQGSGLVVNISSHGAEGYLLSVPYGVGKAAIDKVTKDTAFELRPHGVTALSLWPGLVLTEGLLANTVLTEDGRRELHGLDVSFGETPKFNGKAVVALAADPDILERAGGSFWTATLAREYGFTEDDGHLPPETPNGILSSMGDDMPDFWKGVERAPSA
jgi:NAD(P)-dependent dehydrogenase (short-subunit alcohol dehydrogenase family)